MFHDADGARRRGGSGTGRGKRTQSDGGDRVASVRPFVVSVVTRLRKQYSREALSNLLEGRISISLS